MGLYHSSLCSSPSFHHSPADSSQLKAHGLSNGHPLYFLSCPLSCCHHTHIGSGWRLWEPNSSQKWRQPAGFSHVTLYARNEWGSESGGFCVAWWTRNRAPGIMLVSEILRSGLIASSPKSLRIYQHTNSNPRAIKYGIKGHLNQLNKYLLGLSGQRSL